MSHPRICSSNYEDVSPRPTTFLDLPENLRYRIYYYQDGMATNTSVYFRAKEATFFESALDHLPTTAIISYSNLRLVSRTVKNDIPRSLCSHYPVRLYIEELTKTSCPILLEAPWNLLNYCRRLTVILNTSRKCYLRGRAGCPCLYCRSDGQSHYGPPCISRPWDENVAECYLPTWSKLIRHLSSSPNLSTLELGVRCDVENVETAEAILLPLRDLRIPKCIIRLSRTFIPQLERLAREAVLAITSLIPSVRDPFRFLDLPSELRSRILAYTDLITPDREIRWRERFYPADQASPKRLYCSWGEFCSQHRAAFPTCVCWRVPSPLFLVCREMLQDARQVFFTSNRFIVHKETWPHRIPYKARREKFEAARFLTEIVPRDSLGHLRDLELGFPPRDYSHMGIAPWVLRDWERAVQCVAAHLKKLSLTLYLARDTSFYDCDPLVVEDLKESQQLLHKVHEQIVRPLQQLQPILSGFFVHVGTPFQELNSPDADWHSMQPIMKANETCLERLVMGKEHDSVAKGKLQRKSSYWLGQLGQLGEGDLDGGRVSDCTNENYQVHLLTVENYYKRQIFREEFRNHKLVVPRDDGTYG